MHKRVCTLAFLLAALSAVTLLCISGMGAGSEDTGAGSEDTGAGSEDTGAGSEDTGAGSEDTGAEDQSKPPKKKVKLYDSDYIDNNDSCLVCHLDFKKEIISATHLKHDITCAACHGDSEAHRGDEWNVVRPDVLWGRAEIRGFCMQCHPKHEKSKAYDAFVAEWMDKRRVTGRYVSKDLVCTDCHGKHAIIIGENEFK